MSAIIAPRFWLSQYLRGLLGQTHTDQKGRGMEDASAGQLRRVIEAQHGAKSTFVKSIRVHKAATGDWDGMVHVFDLNNHPKAKRAFAWSSRL